MSQQQPDYSPPAQPQTSLPNSGIPLFKAFGIQVYLHWAWLVIAVIEIQNRRGSYTSIIWNIAEYLSLFGIVLLHEFGHALACRSVGGQADRIMLWPLGGVAFVSPPQRPGAVLWSIAAGPLVNLVLVPITWAALFFIRSSNLAFTDFHYFMRAIAVINLVLLIFNMLPIYPLDGGQILRALLWFIVGQGRSLMIASFIGLIGSAAGLVLALVMGNFWLVIMAAFAAMQSFGAFQRSRAMAIAGQESITLRNNVKCPACGASPPLGPYWGCPCGKSFDVFEYKGTCPNCGGQFMAIPCPACRQASAPFAWFTPITPAPIITPAPNRPA